MSAADIKTDDAPKYGYTVGDQDRIACPWCVQSIVLESEDAHDGVHMECPHCDRPIRMRVDRHVTIRLYPVEASS